jgi:hypothetical protein
VGDVAPYTSDTAPNFGQGFLNILALIQELFAVNNVPGYVPAACSDRFDAMDAYPVDTATMRGGDGVLDIRDLIVELFRVNNLDTSRPMRTTRNGVCAFGSGTSGESPTDVSRTRDFPLRSQSGVEGSLTLGDPVQSGAGVETVPVYLEAKQGLVQVAVTFALGDQQSQLRFLATPQTPPSIAQDSQPGVVAAAWFGGVSVPAGERLLLGYVTGPADALANLKLYGNSVSAAQDLDQLPHAH